MIYKILKKLEKILEENWGTVVASWIIAMAITLVVWQLLVAIADTMEVTL